MSFWTAAVIIVAIWALVKIMHGRRDERPGNYRNQELLDGDEDGERPVREGRREAALQSEIERLRERLEVLERIATDANSREAIERKRLETEIDNLRDENRT